MDSLILLLKVGTNLEKAKFARDFSNLATLRKSFQHDRILYFKYANLQREMILFTDLDMFTTTYICNMINIMTDDYNNCLHQYSQFDNPYFIQYVANTHKCLMKYKKEYIKRLYILQ